MNYRATVLQAAALPLVFKSTRAPYHCVASPWETAGTQQLEWKERSRGSAESNPPLIKTLRLTLLDLTFRRGKRIHAARLDSSNTRSAVSLLYSKKACTNWNVRHTSRITVKRMMSLVVKKTTTHACAPWAAEGRDPGFNCAQPACAVENMRTVGKRAAELADHDFFSLFFFFLHIEAQGFLYLQGFLFTQKSDLSQQKIHFHISAVDLRLQHPCSSQFPLRTAAVL